MSTITPLWTQWSRKFSATWRRAGHASRLRHLLVYVRVRLWTASGFLAFPIRLASTSSTRSTWKLFAVAGRLGVLGLFDANKDKAQVSDKHTAYLELKLYLATGSR